MSRYFFDFQDSNEMTSDDEGVELATPARARAAAIELLSHVAKDELPDGESRCFEVTVREAGHQIIYHATLTFHGQWRI